MPAGGRARAKEQPPPHRKQPPGVCFVATGPGSVVLTVPQAKLVDHRRGRTATEVFDGFSAVLLPDSSQNDIFTQVRKERPSGCDGSDKTRTVFGTVRNPGLVPLTLQKIFTAADESEGGNQSPRYASLDESSDLVSQKRTNVSLVCQENKKNRKVNKPEPKVLTAEEKDSILKCDDNKLLEKDEFLNSELQRVSRSEQIMMNLFNALWTVSKQKRLESEVAAKSMRELLRDKDIEIIELKKELDDLKSCCSHEKFPIAEDINCSKLGFLT